VEEPLVNREYDFQHNAFAGDVGQDLQALDASPIRTDNT
jgi:hypothetical protein